MFTEAQFLEIYQRQQESGLNIKEFCLNEGVHKSTFYYWRKKLGEQGRLKGFIPVVVKTSPPPVTQDYRNIQAPAGENCGAENDFLLELVYTNGTKLRVKKDIDLSHLRTLINLLD